MKCTAIFLVLSMVVLMAQPAEGIWGRIFEGVRHGFKQQPAEQQQQQLVDQQQQQHLNKRAFEQLEYN
uniref:Uncharacterized protein n=1 Tax=Oryzias latipes TaxID=8090 RepID=H2L362_ORYLA